MHCKPLVVILCEYDYIKRNTAMQVLNTKQAGVVILCEYDYIKRHVDR